MKQAVLDKAGKKIKDIELKDSIFKKDVNEPLVHQVVVAEMANMREGNASTKTRALVAGGGTKPWRQKGTGRARAGSIRSPLWRGGGITFGPQPRDYYTRIPRKMRKEAIRSALSAKAKDSEIIVIDKIDFKEAKTKQAIQMLEKIKVSGKAVIITSETNDAVEKSFRNIPGVRVVPFGEMLAYDILDNKNLVLTGDCVDKISEVFSG